MRGKSGDLESLSGALRNEDDLGKVVRAHIHIEHELQEFIFFAAPVPDQLKSFDSMEFTEKVQLALLLGLTPDLKAALNATGRLRNKFAHRQLRSGPLRFALSLEIFANDLTSARMSRHPRVRRY